MEYSEIIALLIVGLSAFILLRRFFVKKDANSCCEKKCSVKKDDNSNCHEGR